MESKKRKPDKRESKLCNGAPLMSQVFIKFSKQKRILHIKVLLGNVSGGGYLA